MVCLCVNSRLVITSLKQHQKGRAFVRETSLVEDEGSVTVTLTSTPVFNVKVVEENPLRIQLTALVNSAEAYLTGEGCEGRKGVRLEADTSCILQGRWFGFHAFGGFCIFELMLTHKYDSYRDYAYFRNPGAKLIRRISQSKKSKDFALPNSLDDPLISEVGRDKGTDI